MQKLKITLFVITSLFLFPFSVFAQESNVNTESNDGQISAISAEPTESGHSTWGKDRSDENIEYIVVTGIWTATDYQAGDIVSSTYVVQQGDTLWEISEAYLEYGIYWTIILEQNADQIGFLADGSQALIYPGQILKL
jgi:nucleoid-associated protein YgaU